MDRQIGLYIDGAWHSQGRSAIAVRNPATGEPIATVACAVRADLEMATASAVAGFRQWSRTTPVARASLLRDAASRLRKRAPAVAPILTQEQGKPLAEATSEIMASADVLDWFAEEARRTYGRLVPSRARGVQQAVAREPVGPVAAFTPWNFPVNQIVRKLGPALAAGCSIIIKGPEEAPGAPAELVKCLAEAGLPAGVVTLLFGDSADISGFLIPHPCIAKISFTGSVPVGKRLAALAGAHMKRVTMELGGHAPVVIFDDADVGHAVPLLLAAKFRNAGQVCIAPTRFLVQRRRHDEFIDRFARGATALRVGNGLLPGTNMGPLAHGRRMAAVEALVDDATRLGAAAVSGGQRIGDAGWFYEPTVLIGATPSMRIMNEEPFGPVAPVAAFDDPEEALAEANRLPFGLAAYAFTRSAYRARLIGEKIAAGMVAINHVTITAPETPFGGIRDSGYGSEGGSEAMDAYLQPKLVSHLVLEEAA